MTPQWKRQPSGRQRHSHRTCRAEPVSDQERDGHREGTGTLWRLGHLCHPTQLAAQQCTRMPQNGAEGPFPPICVHSRDPPTAAHATGRDYGSRDIDGPMVPVMPWGSDLRPTPPERVTQPPTRTHEPGITSSGKSGQGRQPSDTRRRDTSRANFQRRLPEHLRPQYHRHAA